MSPILKHVKPAGLALFFAAATAVFSQPFVPLFNGTDLQGWHPIGAGQWTVSNGEIVGRHPIASEGFGHLVTDSSYTDFTVRFQFRHVVGNSGFYFRVAEGGWAGVIGMQAEIDPGNGTTGGIYEVSAVTSQDRAWVFKTTKSRDSAIYVAGAWNDMTIHAQGGNILITLNGRIMTNLVNDVPGRKQGKFALQIHGGEVGEMRFRNLEIALPVTGIMHPGIAGKAGRGSPVAAYRNLLGVRVPASNAKPHEVLVPDRISDR